MRLAVDIERLTNGIRALRTVRALIRQGVDVGKLSDVADRIKAKKFAHEAKAEEWGRRLDKIDAREPDAFAAGDAVVAERELDLASMEADLRQLSNFAPLPVSPGGSQDSPKLPAAPTLPPVAETAPAGPQGSQDGTGAFVRRVQQP